MKAYFRYLQMLGMRQMLVIPIEEVSYNGETYFADECDTLRPGLNISVMAYAPGITSFYILNDLITGNGYNQMPLIQEYKLEYDDWLRYVQ